MEKKGHGQSGGGGLVERLPQALLLDILSRLDLYSLCSAAPLCRTLRISVSQSLSSISSLDLSVFAPTIQILNRVLGGNNIFQSLILDCSRLDDSSVDLFAKEQMHELTLLKCSSFSSFIFVSIGDKCPNLRHLVLDMGQLAARSNEKQTPIIFNRAIAQMLKGCSQLESLALKFQLQYPGTVYFDSIWLNIPKTIKNLLLQPVSNTQARLPSPDFLSLQSLSLVLDIITDDLILSLTNNLPNLIELCLEDNLPEIPNLQNDLTNNGLQSLSFCHNLTRLSLTRNKQSSFQRVNDIGILILAEGCKKLESVRLSGFSRVTDAGYVTLLHSCKNLRRFEITNALFLSDLAFLDLINSASSIIEVRLVSCNLLTSETANSLSYCRNLEVLDLSGCRSIADPGLVSISKLQNLTLLDLGGADITDTGLSSLGSGSSPISSLCLRGCKRVTDNGISLMFHGNSILSLTLSTLDLGHLPRVTDRSIKVISEVCKNLTNLCLRSCFFITDASIARLSSVDRGAHSGSVIQMLDLCHCSGLSVDVLNLFARPNFRGLNWLGIGNTRLVPRGNGKITEILGDRMRLKICKNGCEMGCKNEWQFHTCT